MAKCLLFAYGLLKVRYGVMPEPSQSWTDAVHGELFDLGPYPAAIRIDQVPDAFEGEVLEIEVSLLPMLDQFEDVEEGQYRRIQTTTLAGHRVWIYEYLQPLPTGAIRLRRWERNAQVVWD